MSIENTEFVVKHTRGVSVYVEDDCELCYATGSTGLVKVAESSLSETIAKWMETLRELANSGVKRIMVIGPIESGKSTFTLWVYNYLNLCYIEGDIGQNEHGLPAMVSVALPGKKQAIMPQDLNADAAWFVGHVAPEKVLPLVFRGLKHATTYCNKGYVIDTDGYIYGRGLYYKVGLIETLEPDAVVSTDFELARKLSTLIRIDLFSIPKPTILRERSRVDRRSFRERAYARLFSTSHRITIDLNETEVVNLEACKTLTEDELPINIGRVRPKYILDCNNQIYVVSEKSNIKPVKKDNYTLLSRNWEQGLLAGIDMGNYEAPGFVETIDFNRNIMILRTPLSLDRKPKYVMLGFIRLDSEYREIEKLEPGLYPSVIATR